MSLHRFAAAATLVLTATLTGVAAQAANTGEAFLVTRTQVFHPENADRAVEIPSDSMMTVLESQTDARGDLFVHVGIDSDVAGVPSDLWLRETELETAGLERLDKGVDVDANLSLLDNLAKKKMTYCYRFVKLYLMQKGLVRGYLPGSSAWQAKNYLPAHGFQRTGQGPSGSRVNDVCVYTGGNGNNGHIEVRTSAGWYYGYGYKSTPISLNNHRLIACYRKH